MCELPSTGCNLNVKSPVSPAKPVTTNVYVPVSGSVCTTNSGEVPVSTCCSTFPCGSLSVRIRSVLPDGMPSAIARTVCPAVPL